VQVCLQPPKAYVVAIPILAVGIFRIRHSMDICARIVSAENIHRIRPLRSGYSARPMFGIETKSTRQRLLELMMARVGRNALAASLGVPCAILADWINGDSVMPDAKLVALIHLIDETGQE